MKKVTLTSCGDNSGKLEFNCSQSKIIEIKRGRFILPDKNSNPLYDEDNKYYKRIYSLEYNNKNSLSSPKNSLSSSPEIILFFCDI